MGNIVTVLKEETSRPAVLGNWCVLFLSALSAGSIGAFSDAADGLSRYCSGEEQDIIAVRALGVERIRC